MRTWKQVNVRFVVTATALSLALIFVPGFECPDERVLPDGFYEPVEGVSYFLRFVPTPVIVPAGGSGNVTFTFSTRDPDFFNRAGDPSWDAGVLEFEIGAVPEGLEVSMVEAQGWRSGIFRERYEIKAARAARGIYRVAVQARGLSADETDPNPWNIYAEGTLTVLVVPWGLTGAPAASQIAGGAYHTLAILEDGSVWSWGMNDKGQLGDGTTTSRLAPVPVQGLPAPAAAVAAGDAHCLALLADGSVWGWGDNRKNQLSWSEHRDFLLPITTAGAERGAVAVAAGAAHSVLLTAGGSILTRGANDLGQLGRRSAYQPPLEWHPPYEWHSVDLDIPRVFTDIGACGDSSLAIEQGGRVWGWGDNGAGQFGVESPSQFLAPSFVDAPLAIAVAAGRSHALVLLTDGTVRAIGDNFHQQLGVQGPTSHRGVTVPGLSGIVAIDAGFFHSMALDGDGRVFAWGDGGFGQLATPASSPQTPIDGLFGMRAIAAGGRHSLALVADCPGAWAWGDNGAGQLGDGTGASTSIPVQVDRIGRTGSIAACDMPLSVIIVGKGAVRSPAVGLECTTTCGESFPPDTVLALTADPDNDWFFVGWAGDATGSNETVILRLDSAKNCIAYFAPAVSPPTARFTFSPQYPLSTDKVVLDASESFDNGQIILYQWDFENDGEFDVVMHNTELGGSFTAAFVREGWRAGSHTVRLRVTDNDGLTDETTGDVLVGQAEPPEYDLGDAPDSSNSAGRPILAYAGSGVEAHFPSVHGPGAPPHGPRHHRPRNGIYLGRAVTQENEADVGMDEDPNNNLNWLRDEPDQDEGDDGVQLPLRLPDCQWATVRYTVTAVDPPHQYMYVNVWFDWNRDGDWDDTLTCPDGSTVREWAVRNDEQYFFQSGTSTLTTSSFKCWHPSKDLEQSPLWMRITLSEEQPPANGSGGAGPDKGYEYGETEDYLIFPQ